MIWRVIMVGLAMSAPAVALEGAAAPSSTGNWIAPVGPGSTDAELEQIVRAAYQAAIDYAAINRNYFARDGVTAPLREAIAAGISAAGISGVDVAVKPSPSLAAARICLGRAGTELRFVVNVFGDGLSLAAVTATRGFAYDFDPREMNDVLVYRAENCKPAS